MRPLSFLGQHGAMPPRTARALAREQITREILEAGRRQLADVGPAGLSLRAVAREVGMVSSAVYRYFSSRDELLTALLIDSYDSLGMAAEEADDPGATSLERWRAVCGAIRGWALAHRHEYALLYGSPVPGYVAPQATVGPAGRAPLVLVRIVMSAAASGARPLDDDVVRDGDAAAVAEGIELIAALGWEGAVPTDLVVRTLMAWVTVYGTISFELFGHLVGSVSDGDLFYASVVDRLAADLGVAPHRK